MRKLRSACRLLVKTIDNCQLPVFTSNCQLPVFTSNCQLLMFMSNSCLQVVVAGDATFQDVKSEIVRVYQGISSASLDERYASLISVMCGMLPCCKHESSLIPTSLLETGLDAAMPFVQISSVMLG